MSKLTEEQRRKNMQAVKNKDSAIEKSLAVALWSKGFRYRKNDKTVFGNPDLTFKRLKIAIFVDGDFWHGKDWNQTKHHHKSNIEFWHKKIERNIARDILVNRTLSQSEWLVLRFWGSEIKKDLNGCVALVIKAIKSRQQR